MKMTDFSLVMYDFSNYLVFLNPPLFKKNPASSYSDLPYIFYKLFFNN